MSLPRVKEHNDALLAIGDAYRLAEVPTAFMACGFAGGFGLGARAAGFKVIGGVEAAELPFAIRTAQQGWNVMVEAQANWSNGKLASKLRTTFDGSAPDVLLMNPPCSAYAKNGKRGGMDDPVMCNLRACIDLGLALSPVTWCWELVPGIYEDQAGRAFLDELAVRCAKEGYHSYVFLTSSALHGGFQDRHRFHFIASRIVLNFEATFEAEPPERLGWRTVAEAIGKSAPPIPALNNRRVPCGSLEAVLPHVPPGTYVNQVPDSVLRSVYKPRGRDWETGQGAPGVSRIRAMWDRPSATIVGGPSVVHPEEDRFLTVRENARLMGFPDDWEFPEGSAGYQEVGKGLTIHTAAFVSRVIIDGLKTRVPAEPTLTLDVIDWRKRSEAPGLTSTPEFKREWYLVRHGIPWTGGSRQPGRPQGYSPKRAAVVSVRIASDSTEVKSQCESLGLTCVPFAEAVSTDIAVSVADAANTIMMAFALGSSKASRRILCCPVDGLQLPGVEIVGSVAGVLDELAAYAAPVLRARLAKLVSEIEDGLLLDAIETLEALVIGNEESEEVVEE